MSHRRLREDGMVTAEIAVAMPALLLVTTIALSAVGAVTDQLRCVDAARTGARLLARGEPVERVRTEVAGQAPAGATVQVRVMPDDVTVTVTADPPPLLESLGIGLRPRGTARAAPEEPSP
ncbi:hypothetical protein BCF74_10987 [Knoellia remsis]|uniref:TadE-like protein n=1 Tax=Knoellia remsis TaxID=407159 RepID=A0A2T0UNS7_9MICO|nr:TadE family type IV pilus minor pilin [Knoellia remsis]PRY59497.1 hypothetical protein BCF74_10987 [Knoellia remsis]